MRALPLLVLLLALVPHSVVGIAIGVNRGSIEFTDVLRDGYAQAEVVVTTDSDTPISGGVLLDGSEASQWLNFSAREFNFSVDAPYHLIVSIHPPLDAKIDAYRVNMSIITGELSRTEGGLLGTTTRASLGVPVFLSMTGTERAACQIGGVRVLDMERGQQLEVQMTVINTGNVRLNPPVELEVYDKLRERTLDKPQRLFGSSVLPTVSQDGSVLFALSLPRDQYWTSVRVPQCGYTGLFSFDILEAGETKDDGEFMMIDAPSWASVGEIIPVKAIFRNNGVRALRSVFKGTIARMDDDRIVKVIDSETYIINPGVTGELETFFNPTEPGQYVVTGKIFYNDKLTQERNAIINVNGEPLQTWWGGRARALVFLCLLGVIALLLVLIIRRKRRPPLGASAQRAVSHPAAPHHPLPRHPGHPPAR